MHYAVIIYFSLGFTIELVPKLIYYFSPAERPIRHGISSKLYNEHSSLYPKGICWQKSSPRQRLSSELVLGSLVAALGILAFG